MQLQGDAFTLLMGMGNVSNGACWLNRHRLAVLVVRPRLTFVFGSEADGSQGCS